MRRPWLALGRSATGEKLLLLLLLLYMGNIITFCTEFSYLGSIFTKDGEYTKTISHGVTQARKIIAALNWVWWTKTGKRLFITTRLKVS
jgi:hypothetical protein